MRHGPENCNIAQRAARTFTLRAPTVGVAMHSSNRTSNQKHELLFERAIQLRRETIAAMKLRSTSALRCLSDSRVSVEAKAPPRSAGQTRIMAISDYEGLRTSREQVLSLEGFLVESVSSSAVFEDSWIKSFDIAVVCQSIEAEDAVRIARLLRRANPCIAILRVNPSQANMANMENRSLFTYEMDALAGPCGLLHAIEVLGRQMGKG